MRIFKLMLVSLSLSSWGVVQADGVAGIEGIYSHTLSDNTKETLKILKLSPTTAYFELHPRRGFISGIADLQPDGSLLYREDNPMTAVNQVLENHTVTPYMTAREHHWCELGIHFDGVEVTFTDPIDPQDLAENPDSGGACNSLHGGVSGTTLKRKTRRKLTPVQITQMVRSEDFYKAMTWREMYLQGKTPEPF